MPTEVEFYTKEDLKLLKDYLRKNAKISEVGIRCDDSKKDIFNYDGSTIIFTYKGENSTLSVTSGEYDKEKEILTNLEKIAKRQSN